MQDTMINRVLRVSPEQNELYKRNKSRIFIGVEGESLIDTILQQANRPVEDYIDVSHRAIAQAGLSDDYGDIRPMYGTQIGAFGATHLVTQNWLKDESGNVFDLFISVDPDFENMGEPPAQILPSTIIQDGLEGENPLILSVDVTDLVGSPTDMDESEFEDQPQARSSDDDVIPGAIGRVKDESDGRLKENREAGVHVDDGRATEAGKAPAMAREAQTGDDDNAPRRGRVTNQFDRRLKGNRMQRQRQTNDDEPTPPAGGSGGTAGASRAAGGTGRGGRSGSGGGTRAELPTWGDGRPRTIPATKLDGTPRRKPGPALGTKYKLAA